MNLPAEVQVAGIKYTIEYVKTQREVSHDLSSNEYVGELYGSQKIIRIQIDEQIRVTLDTLLHEIIHVVFNQNPIIKASIKPEIGEEAFIGTLGRELAELLINNNWIKIDDIPVTKRII